ncbi:uncharacterized protein A1O9_08374 [Exophiala aquamarina CBS 119918]|uniref:Adenylate cyclase n=1 Tax=Exophiala aquamarina CBS 119918 TaxID=1182545 RepID=A0A072P675_9EURO|nr:uncharacterized protein A1O9_08374 [Exophiala aquamarina CBS 119918]KEF55624.1 hypothetical protein A1O9_08374 [Exophiala aquamarina CBS 119918]
MRKDLPSPSGHLNLRSSRGRAAQAAQAARAARAALQKSSASTLNALGSAEMQRQPSTTTNNSSSVLSDSQNSVLRHSVREPPSNAETPEWKKRLEKGEELTSDGFDLFSPSKLEGVFKERTPTRVHFEDELDKPDEKSRRPFTLPAARNSSQQFSSFRSARQRANDLEVVHEEDEEAVSLSFVRKRPVDPNSSSLSPSSSVYPMKASSFRDPRWRTTSGQEEMKNETISPITMSKQDLICEAAVFQTLNSLKQDVERLEAKIGIAAPSTDARPSSSSSDKEISYGHISPPTDQDITSSSLPDDLSMGTEGFSTYKAIQNHKKAMLAASDVSTLGQDVSSNDESSQLVSSHCAPIRINVSGGRASITINSSPPRYSRLSDDNIDHGHSSKSAPGTPADTSIIHHLDAHINSSPPQHSELRDGNIDSSHSSKGAPDTPVDASVIRHVDARVNSSPPPHLRLSDGKIDLSHSSKSAPETPAYARVKPSPSGSPLKLFGNRDTYTNNKLNRILSKFEEDPDSTFDDLGAKLAAKAAKADAAINASQFGDGALDDFTFEKEVPRPSLNLPEFMNPNVRVYRAPEPNVVSAAMAALLKDSTDAIGFKVDVSPEQVAAAPKIDRTTTKRRKTLRDGQISVKNQNIEVQVAAPTTKPTHDMEYDSDSSKEPFERPPSREGSRRPRRNRNPNISKHTPEVASFLNKFREPSGSDFRDVLLETAPEAKLPEIKLPEVEAKLPERQEAADITDMSVVPVSKPAIQVTPAPKASILSLTPLSEFTLHQTDSGKNQSFVQERHHPSALRQAHGSMALSVDALVKVVTDAVGDTLFWDKLRKINIAPGKLASVHKLKEYLPRVTEVSLPENMVEHVEGLPGCVRTLDMHNNMLSDLTSWSHLTNLQYLDVSGNKLENLDGFCSLTHLRSLKANNNHITNITGIFKLRGLLHLEVRDNKISAVNFSEAKLRRLRTLDLSHNQLKEVLNLHKLQDLQEVDISQNAIEKWLPEKSAHLYGLRKLTASNNMLTSINLKSMPMLKCLDLDFNSINEIPELSAAFHLELLSLRDQADAPNIVDFILSTPNECRQIRLSSNTVVDGSFTLPSLPHYNLRALELAACGISDLPEKFGSYFPNCRQLNLNYNAIKELSPLRGMHKLTHMFAAQNRIYRMRRTCVLLGKLPALREIDMRENPLTVGFYCPASMDGISQPAREDATYRLPLGSPKSDPSWLKRLDDTTSMRRRAMEALLAENCNNLVQLDGMQLRRTELMTKNDKEWTRLTERGVLAVPCFA